MFSDGMLGRNALGWLVWLIYNGLLWNIFVDKTINLENHIQTFTQNSSVSEKPGSLSA